VFSGSTQSPGRKSALPSLGSRRPGIEKALMDIDSKRIQSFAETFSGQFKSRVASGPSAELVSEWLKRHWMDLAAQWGRTDISVDIVSPPSGYTQGNVRVTIPGKDLAAPIVILGGHLDSIHWAGMKKAPGVDDNASGIAAVTEVYRVLLEHRIEPDSTLQIIGYAAEEMGLLGSRALAESYAKANVRVKGVMQLDMVAWPGKLRTMTFITDHVDRALTVWTQQLYGLYNLGQTFKEEQCGYACSDHASWTRYGFPAVMPFEAPTNDMNPRIHSENDLWDSFLDAEYAAQFSKLAYAFAITLAVTK
jgi:bacterial leucyl aminopeptidase